MADQVVTPSRVNPTPPLVLHLPTSLAPIPRQNYYYIAYQLIEYKLQAGGDLVKLNEGWM